LQATRRGTYGQVRKISLETREVGNAPPEEGHPEERLGQSREEPQAGDRDRAERSQTEGRQGSTEVVPQAIKQPETILMPAARQGPIRYAVVGLGHIAQVAVLPAFAHAKRNSRLTAIVSDDAQKRRLVGKKYRVDTYGYSQYDACLEHVDAVYIALPNSMHAEYAIRAARVRTKREMGGGTPYDIGVYCINAARHLFRAEPKAVMAISVNSGAPKLAEIDETTGAVLRFDGERLAAFVTSFNAADVSSYRIVGTKGQVRLDPAYEYADALTYELTVDDKMKRKRIGKRDQFAPELLYFSDCIRQNREPEPSGGEGQQDVRIVQALYESANTGKTIDVPPFQPSKRPSGRQRIKRPGIPKPMLVNAKSASDG
jgi:predicted dehydrogenase